MKRKWNIFFDLLFYMVAGLGLFSLLNLLLKGYLELPILFVLIGLGFGILMWWRENKAMKKMDFGENVKALKFYVYLFQLFVYVLAFFGFVELLALYSGQSSLEAYESEIFTWNSYTFSWRSIFYPFIIILGWKLCSERIIKEAIMNMNMQKT